MNLFLDGMGHYATAGIDKKYTVLNTTNATFTIAAEGRFNNALKKVCSTGVSTGYVEVAPLMTQTGVWTPNASGVQGFAFKIDDLDTVLEATQGNAALCNLFSIYEGVGWILAVVLNPNGTFSVYRHHEGGFGIGSVYLGSSVQGLRSNVWSYLEFKWTIHDSAGSFKIRVNNVEVFSFTGDTSASSASQSFTNVWNVTRYLQLASNAGGGGPHPTMWMCDAYLLDQAGSGDEARDFLGDGAFDYIIPDGIGNDDGFTPLAGDNWENVEEVPPDDDTTYVSATAPSTRDSHTMSNLPAGTVPIIFQTLIYARKETEGAAGIKPTYREAGVTYDANEQGIATPDAYRYIIQPYDTNPATSATITEAEVNAGEFGYVKES